MCSHETININGTATMLIIGLTGGIGSGKSAACKYFHELGAPVIDADVIARQVVSPGQPGLKLVRQTFGEDIVTTAGELNRAKLSDIIFTQPKKRTQLEAILHPLIRTEMLRQAYDLDAPYCIFAIPLLIEAKQTDLVDRILVIDAPDTLRRQRLKQRDHLNDEQINAILAAQVSRQTRLDHADDIIHNDADLTHLNIQVTDLHRRYTKLAGHNAGLDK